MPISTYHGPRDVPQRAERASQGRVRGDDLLREHHESHGRYPQRHADDCVALYGAPPEDPEKETAEQPPVRERCDRQRDDDDRRTLLGIKQRAAGQHDTPDKGEDLAEPKGRRIVRTASAERQIDIVVVAAASELIAPECVLIVAARIAATINPSSPGGMFSTMNVGKIASVAGNACRRTAETARCR